MDRWHREKANVWATLRGDWWHYAGALQAYCSVQVLMHATPGNISAGGVTLSVAAILQPGQPPIGQPLGTITFVGSDDSTRIYVTFASTEEAPAFWDKAIKLLKETSAYAAHFRREAGKITADDVIEIYYRRRAAGTRGVTLQKLAQEFRFNRTYLSDVKKAYDEAGKWGSKKSKLSGGT